MFNQITLKNYGIYKHHKIKSQTKTKCFDIKIFPSIENQGGGGGGPEDPGPPFPEIFEGQNKNGSVGRKTS